MNTIESTQKSIDAYLEYHHKALSLEKILWTLENKFESNFGFLPVSVDSPEFSALNQANQERCIRFWNYNERIHGVAVRQIPDMIEKSESLAELFFNTYADTHK